MRHERTSRHMAASLCATWMLPTTRMLAPCFVTTTDAASPSSCATAAITASAGLVPALRDCARQRAAATRPKHSAAAQHDRSMERAAHSVARATAAAGTAMRTAEVFASGTTVALGGTAAAAAANRGADAAWPCRVRARTCGRLFTHKRTTTAAVTTAAVASSAGGRFLPLLPSGGTSAAHGAASVANMPGAPARMAGALGVPSLASVYAPLRL